jgi:hypothetical protein
VRADSARYATFARPGDAGSAQLLVGFLCQHEIDTWVLGGDALSIALGSPVRVLVREDQVVRARWLVAAAEPTDAEAWFLATGELDPVAAKAAFVWPRQSGLGRCRWAVVTLAALMALTLALGLSR